MTPFDRSRTSSYSSFIVTMSLSSTVTEIFSVEYWDNLEIFVRNRSRALKRVPINRYDFILVGHVGVFCTVFEIKRDIGGKTPIFL